MEDLVAIREKAVQVAVTASQLDKENKYEEAFEKYVEAIKYFKHLFKSEKNSSLSMKYRNKLEEYLQRATILKEILQGKGRPQVIDKVETGIDNDSIRKKREQENLQFWKQFSNLISLNSNVKWDDVVGLEIAKSILQENIILPIKFPHLFTGLLRPCKGILIYGPPGAGKTYLAKACASQATITLFSVCSSDLDSKWLGESEKMIKSLFNTAKENLPAMILLDEIDSFTSIMSYRDNDVSHTRCTEFLVQMQGTKEEKPGLMVLGTTNCPWNLTPAVRRRFTKRIYIPLPEESVRAKMFMLKLEKSPSNLSEEDFQILAKKTEGYSCYEIACIVKETIIGSLKKCQNATKFRHTPDGFIEPTFLSDPEGFEDTINNLKDPSKLRLPKITLEDMMKSVAAIKPSVSKKYLEQLEAWTAEFGSNDSQQKFII